MTPAPIIFLHIPKTGGVSIQQVLRDVYGKTRHATSRRWNGEWDAVSPRHLDGSVWAGHFSFGWHTLLPEPVPYFTVVRDPIAREISRFRNDSRRYINQSPYESYDVTWNMTYMLSGIPRAEEPELNESHVGLALRNMREHFLFVGDTARMGEVGLWMRDVMGWNVSLPFPHHNKADHLSRAVTEAEIEELRTHPKVQVDQLLYDQICLLGPWPQEWDL